MDKAKKAFLLTLMHTFLISVAVSCIFPLVWMIMSSFKTYQEFIQIPADINTWRGFLHWFLPHKFNLANYISAWRDGNLGMYFLNSVIYTFLAVSGIVFVSSLAGFAFSRLEFWGRDFIFHLFLAAMMIPIPAGFVPLFVLLTRIHLVNTRLGYILAMINVGLSLSIYLFKTFFDNLPRDLEDAARIDGCSKLRIWWNVAFPLAAPATGVVIIFNALNVWNEFILAVIIFADKAKLPLQAGLMEFAGEHIGNEPLIMAGLTIAALPIIVVYLLMQKHIIKGITAGAMVG